MALAFISGRLGRTLRKFPLRPSYSGHIELSQAAVTWVHYTRAFGLCPSWHVASLAGGNYQNVRDEFIFA